MLWHSPPMKSLQHSSGPPGIVSQPLGSQSWQRAGQHVSPEALRMPRAHLGRQSGAYEQGGGPAALVHLDETEASQQWVGPPGLPSQPAPPHLPQALSQHVRPSSLSIPLRHRLNQAGG